MVTGVQMRARCGSIKADLATPRQGQRQPPKTLRCRRTDARNATGFQGVKHHLKALKRPTMPAECEKMGARCARENVDHLGFLLQLSESELLDRERRAAANKPQIPDLMKCDYIERRENVLLIGGSDPGKKHLATALAMEACGRGKRVRFLRVTALAALLLEAREERQLPWLRSQLAKLDLLVPDELGCVPASKVGAELLFDVVSTAYERSSVIVATNLPSRSGRKCWQRAADGGDSGLTDASLHDRGDWAGELSAAGGPDAAA
jgi:hypothetical protein